MVNLQSIKRKDGTQIFTCTIPKRIVEQAMFVKGSKLCFKCLGSKMIEITEVKSEDT